MGVVLYEEKNFKHQTFRGTEEQQFSADFFVSFECGIFISRFVKDRNHQAGTWLERVQSYADQRDQADKLYSLTYL